MLELIHLATQFGLPTIYPSSVYLTDGALMSYEGDTAELYRGVAGYVDRLLRGAKVGDLPVQYPTRFRLGINVKAAKGIGLTIPEAFLLRADEVIE
jgi:putative ABC transport system substrate-binding protein